MNHINHKLRGRLEVAALIAAVLIGVALALPAQGQECADFTIEMIDGTSHITGRQDAPGIQVSLEGHYLWVNLGEPADPLYPELDVEASHNVTADVVGATVCPDGSVTFASATPSPVAEANDEPAPAVVVDVQPAELVTPLPVLYPATAVRLAALVG